MAEGTSKESIVESIEEGRRQLEDEAAYLKVQLSPSHVASNLWDRHHRAIILLTLAAGMAIPQLLKRRRHPSEKRRDDDDHKYVVYRDKNPESSMLSTLLKLATPFVVKAGIKAFSQYAQQQAAVSHYQPPPVCGDDDDASGRVVVGIQPLA